MAKTNVKKPTTNAKIRQVSINNATANEMSKCSAYIECLNNMKNEMSILKERVKQDVKDNPVKLSVATFALGLGLGVALKTIHYNTQNDKKRRTKNFVNKAIKAMGGPRKWV